MSWMIGGHSRQLKTTRKQGEPLACLGNFASAFAGHAYDRRFVPQIGFAGWTWIAESRVNHVSVTAVARCNQVCQLGKLVRAVGRWGLHSCVFSRDHFCGYSLVKILEGDQCG